MEITKSLKDKSLTLSIAGRLDTTTAPQFEKAIDESISGVTALIIDMKNLEYISSAGLRVILKAQKAMNSQGSMKLVNVNDMIMDVFDITGFLDILTIE